MKEISHSVLKWKNTYRVAQTCLKLINDVDTDEA